MAAGSASGLGGSEVTGVRVDVEDHVGRIVSNDRVGVGGHVIEESIYSFHCFFLLVLLVAMQSHSAHTILSCLPPSCKV